MKKYYYIIATLILGLTACTERMPVPVPEGEATVTIDMMVSLPQSVTATKAMNRDSNPQIENIYVAVFGSRGYLNDYALAIPIDKVSGIVKSVMENGVVAKPYIGVFSRRGGAQAISLKEPAEIVVDLMTGEVLGENTARIEFLMPKNASTVLLYAGAKEDYRKIPQK